MTLTINQKLYLLLIASGVHSQQIARKLGRSISVAHFWINKISGRGYIDKSNQHGTLRLTGQGQRAICDVALIQEGGQVKVGTVRRL